MYLKDVLDIHKSYRPDLSQAEILGDGYLLQSNPVYQKVKRFALEIGVEYVEAYPQYLLLPFHELQKIVETKRVPFVPSGRLMEDVEKNRPGVFTTSDVPMPQSYHLHESAHVIAEHFFGRVAISTPQEKILKAILCESFANTVDALVCVPATQEVHLFFVLQNSYMHPQKKAMQAMARLIDAMGFRFTFMLTYFSYVHANFLADNMNDKAIKALAAEYAPEAKLSIKLLKDAQAVCNMADRLDPQFRAITTANYLKLEGFDGELMDLIGFPFTKVLEGNKSFQKSVLSLAAVLQ